MKRSCVLLVMLWLTGCASNPYQAPVTTTNVKNEADLAALELESQKKPDNLVLRSLIVRQKDLLIDQLCREAETAKNAGNLDQAESLYNRVLNLNPLSPQGNTGIKETQSARRHQEWLRQAETYIAKGNFNDAESKLHDVLLEDSFNARAKSLLKQIAQTRDISGDVSTELRTSYNSPVTLEFREVSIRTIFEIISKTANINFIFDKEVKPDLKATIFVRNIRMEDAIKILLSTNQLQQKILSDNTILIYPNTPAKLREYQELVVRSFYLANADVKQTSQLIKTITKTNDVFVDEKLNMIVVRDTPEVIKLIEKLIAAQDMAEPEVMLELEVLEVSRNKLQELGVRYPDQISASAIGAAGTAGTLTANEWQHLNGDMIRLSATNPSFILNLKKIDTDTNLLANPRIRVRNRENAKIHIGERVPVITTTSTANVGVSESVAYLDVGLKLDIVPNIYLEDEVAMKVSLEVSNILDTIVRPTGTQTYRLGTRNTETTLRLRNGETEVLAGLIQDDQRRTGTKVPGLSSLPILGHLFTSNSDNNTKTEIVLLITPRIIRNLSQPDLNITEFNSGTADVIGRVPVNLRATIPASPLSPPVNSGVNVPLGALSVSEPVNNTDTLQPNVPTKVVPITPISPIPSMPQPIAPAPTQSVDAPTQLDAPQQ